MVLQVDQGPDHCRGRRQALLNETVRKAFVASRATFGSLRVHEDLIDPALPHPELTGDVAEVLALHAAAAGDLLIDAVEDEQRSAADVPGQLPSQCPRGVAHQTPSPL